MKKIIITIILIAMCTALMVGCGMSESTEQPQETTSFYEYEDAQDFFKLVYSEQRINIWVNVLDKSVWIQYDDASLAPYTINGHTVFWRGSMKETFSYDNIK